MNRPALTQERALSILQSLKHIKDSDNGVPKKNVEVSSINYTDADGKPFKWSETDEEYAIVNFKAINSYGLEKAKALFREGRFQDALNNNLSMRMSIEEADQIGPKTVGTLTCRLTDVKGDDGETTQGLLPYSFKALAATDSENVDISDLMPAKADGKKELVDEDGNVIEN